jgi:hypothetical protein
MRLAGKNTQITLKLGAGTPATVPANNWTMDASKDDIDATNFLDANKVTLKGLPNLSGNLSGFFDSATSYILFSAALGTEVITMEVTLDSVSFPAEKIYGPVNIDAGLESTVDGAITSNGTWAASGVWNLESLKTAWSAIVATGATAGTPGTFTPAGANAPATLAGMTGITATPATAWTTGQHVVLGDLSKAYWNATAWTAGQAP